MHNEDVLNEVLTSFLMQTSAKKRRERCQQEGDHNKIQ